MVLILDNGTTAMTGHQEHPGTGRTLDHEPTGKVVVRGIGTVARAQECVQSPIRRPTPAKFAQLVQACLANKQLNLIIARRPCLLIAGAIKEYERAANQSCTAALDEPE